MRRSIGIAGCAALALFFSFAPVAAAGPFDHYVLALSWSPQHCASTKTRPGDTQCATGRRFGFVAHGLWPQHEKGWPEFCGGRALDASLVEGMLDIMPSRELVRHQWKKHGTCSGLAAAAYFDRVREAFRSVKIPAEFQGPRASVRTSPGRFRRALLEANPALRDDGVAIVCRGRFLSEVRVCLDTGLRPRRCSPGTRDRCPGPEMIVRPVR